MKEAMLENWDQRPIYVIDFEGSVGSGIVEYGIVAILGSQIQNVETRICRPTKRIAQNEQEAHGITNDEACAMAPFSEEWERFATLREKGPLAAHFASAENSMLKGVFPYPRVSENWARPGESLADWGPWLDTGGLYKGEVESGESLNLRYLIERYELQEELDELASSLCPENRRKYHCALYDAIASALLLIVYCEDVRGGKVDIQQLAILSKTCADQKQSASQSELF